MSTTQYSVVNSSDNASIKTKVSNINKIIQSDRSPEEKVKKIFEISKTASLKELPIYCIATLSSPERLTPFKNRSKADRSIFCDCMVSEIEGIIDNFRHGELSISHDFAAKYNNGKKEVTSWVNLKLTNPLDIDEIYHRIKMQTEATPKTLRKNGKVLKLKDAIYYGAIIADGHPVFAVQNPQPIN